jgi:predicted acyltransferase
MTTVATAPTKSVTRLASLDVFRGMAVAGMVFVNNPGSWDHVWTPFDHAAWNGCTPTDLVFPFFLFIVGVAMAFSLEKYTPENRPTAQVYWRILRRSALLFGFGLLLNGFPFYDLSTIRILGVLQRISLTYLFASLIVLNLSRLQQWLMAGFLLVGYWAAMKLIPVPGFGAGMLTDTGNLGAWIDRSLIGTAHLYGQKMFDPEGLLSTLPAIVSVLFGYFAGSWLRKQPIEAQTSKTLGTLGLGCLIFGWLWELVFPINKQLWTSSYVVFTTGWALIVLAICFEIIEVRGKKDLGWPFEVFGMNAIVLFVGSGIVGRILKRVHIGTGEQAPTLVTWIYEHGFAPWAGLLVGSHLYAVANLLVWWLVLYGLYRRRWFLKV